MKRDYRNACASAWYENALTDFENIPFSFVYDGSEYKTLADPRLAVVSKAHSEENGRITNEIRFSLPDGVGIKLIFSHYPTHGVSEWTVWFENNTEACSGVFEKAEARMLMPLENARLTGIYGDHEKFYEPYDLDIPDEGVRFTSDSGRATHVNFPYFNVESEDRGVIAVIGWAGTWTAEFKKTEKGISLTANSVNGLKTYLKSGESIRTALFVYAPYERKNEHTAANFWRSWFVEYNLPKYDLSGRPLEPFSTCCLASDTGLPNSDGSISETHETWKRSLDKMMEEDVKVDFRWFDAGWYIAPDQKSLVPFSEDRDWWHTIGTWVLDESKWPAGTFRESVDYAHAHGIKTLVWFEPERVTDPQNLAKNFGYNAEWAIDRGINVITNNIGDEACFRHTTERILTMLRENHVDMYREDNNSDPASLWAYLDEKEGENRKGVTECKFICNHYRMWDAIIECTLSYGGCGFVDSCASGGGRNDLESMRRGIPLLRSDFDRTSTAIRLSMTTGFNKWIPFCGANTKEKLSQLALTGTSDPYVWRASYLPALNVDSQFVQDPDQDFGVLREGLREWKEISPYLLKEFYVFTPWHCENDTKGFTAFCYFDPDSEKGVLFAFRQEECEEDSLEIRFPFENARVRLTDKDTGAVCETENAVITLSLNEKRLAKLYEISLF